MKTKADRDLNKLNTEFKKKVDLFLKEVGKEIFITEAFRTQERQDELVKAGYSWVKYSNHQDGLAIDIGFYGNELYPSDMNKWRKIADIAKKFGIDWGFDLWGIDKPHFQNGLIKNNTIIKPINMTKYTEILNTYIKNGYKTIFDKREGINPLSEQETKELIEIAFANKKI